MDIMKILAELYLDQLGVEATAETTPIIASTEQETIVKKTA